MYKLTGDVQYADVFRQTWQFVNDKQTDWASGEWFEAVAPGWFDRRRQGASVEGGLPQRPRASRMLATAYPSPAARSPWSVVRNPCQCDRPTTHRAIWSNGPYARPASVSERSARAMPSAASARERSMPNSDG